MDRSASQLPVAEPTIVAEATPAGRAGLAVVRLSGPDAHSLARTVFAPSRGTELAIRRCVHGRVRLSDDASDEATCTLFRAPSSYTGEDVVELGLHGNPWIVSAVLDALVAAGARPAGPGEFTYRAWRHGRLDLTRAEALDALVRASSPMAAREAALQAGGALAMAAGRLEGALLDALAELEAAIDFHDDSVGRRRADQALALVDRLGCAWRAGLLRSPAVEGGLRVVLAGPTNAGKSSLFNALLEDDRAIVTADPGTTRDVLEAGIVLEGVLVTLVDTAGDREATSAAEAEGVRRSRVQRERADVVLEVRDVTVPDRREVDPGGWWVGTKADLLEAGRPDVAGGPLVVSSRTGAGLDELRRRLGRRAREGAAGDGPALLSARQRAVAGRLCGHVGQAVEDRARGAPEEYVADSLREALDALAELVGRADVEDVYDRVFKRFCVGK
jgi:tRNA modification GTPase